MTYNSGLCAANPNMVYSAQGATAVRPHAPTTICGTAVTYDANGNTLSYDVDGAGVIAPRTIAYDGESRPPTVTQSGNVTRFAYGPDGSRALLLQARSGLRVARWGVRLGSVADRQGCKTSLD